ncbi:unnamed protein product [Mytilus coruscus]|uniref:Ig-like domain-containing protein n=1 Tax=Mytilus coruscus TaxID=42192 RepID=A0A6J8EUF4_MYTCO|nr:unnamed protein product [Mytilus coruscus]
MYATINIILRDSSKFCWQNLTEYRITTMMTVQNIYKTIICFGYFILSQSSLRWDIKTTTVIYGQDATLSCNGNGCMPISIRKWIGGPTDDVLCFNDYSSDPAKYQLMYNKSKPSFDLMIKRFKFTDVNCSYTCACGFFQYTNMLQMQEIDFVYPPGKDISSETKQEDGKLYIRMSMRVYPLPNCTINYEDIVLPVKTQIIDVQEELGIKLYVLKLEYVLDVEYKNCRENLTLSCDVRSIEFPLLQQELALCKDHPDAKLGTLVWILLGLVCGFFMVALMVICEWRRRKKRKSRKRQNDKEIPCIKNCNLMNKNGETTNGLSDESSNLKCDNLCDCSTTKTDNNEYTTCFIRSTKR